MTLGEFEDKVGVGNLLDLGGPIVVFRREEAIDFEQILAGTRLVRLRPLLKLLRGQIRVVGKVDVAGDAGADAELLDLLVVDLKHRGRQTIEQIVEKDRPKRLALDASKQS